MISPELMGFTAIGVTVLLAQRAQNNALATRLEEGFKERIDTVERHQYSTDEHVNKVELNHGDRLTTIETVCKMRHIQRPDQAYGGV